MPISPVITFKAGQCELDDGHDQPRKVRPQPKAGYIYLYLEDDLVHFCWRGRSDSLEEPELDLVMVPTDGSFLAYEAYQDGNPTAKTNGRIFVLKFASSSARYLFWLQSNPQARNGDAAWLSPRDRKIGDIVNRLLQGEEINVTRELGAVRNEDNRPDDEDDDDDDDDDDEEMDDAEARQPLTRNRSGGAGPGATGGDVREEGEESREGGSDGARASSGQIDASDAVRQFMESMRSHPALGQERQTTHDTPYPHLTYIMPTEVTISVVDNGSIEFLDNLLGLLPPSLIVSASGRPVTDARSGPTPADLEEAKASLTEGAKKDLLRRVLRSAQFYQGLGVLTTALRDGGLPSVSEALNIQIDNRGYIPGGNVPMGGGAAVKVFVEGIKKKVQKESQS